MLAHCQVLELAGVCGWRGRALYLAWEEGGKNYFFEKECREADERKAEHKSYLLCHSLLGQSFLIMVALILCIYMMPIYRDSETHGSMKNLF